MAVLDFTATWVQRVLAALSPDTARALFIPVFLTVVVVGTTLFVRHVLGRLCRVAGVVVLGAMTLAGTLMLLGEMGVATWYRQADQKPPEVLYQFGDSVAAGIIGVAGRSEPLAKFATRVAKIKLGWIIAVALAGFWLWNYRYCPDGVAGCARPVSLWWADLSG